MQYAIVDGASQIRIESVKCEPISELPDSDKAVVVSYLLAEEWKEQMRLPFYVYYPMFAEMRRRAAMDETCDIGEIVVPLRDESNRLDLNLRVSFEISEDKPTLLRLRFAHTNEAAL